MRLDKLLAARAFESMLSFEKARQQRDGETPLAVYTARLLARKGAELYANAAETGAESGLCEIYHKYNAIVQNLSLSSTQRRRLVNDSHALVVDGLDRHRLWAGESGKIEEMVLHG